MDNSKSKIQDLLQSKNYTAAASEIKLILPKNDTDADLWSTYGVCLFHIGQKEAALEALNKSQQLEPTNPYRYSSRAYIQSILGNTQAAIDDYNKCIELDPDDAIALNNLGLVYEKQGHQKKAQSLFEQADKSEGIDHITQKHKPVPKPDTAAKPPVSEPKELPSKAKVIRHALFSQEGRKEFFQFMFNGFKLKWKPSFKS